MTRLALSLLLLAVLPGRGAGQEQPPPKTLCFNGSRRTDCSNFLIVEMGAYLPVAVTQRELHWEGQDLTSSPVDPAFSKTLEWHVGLMHNVSERWALGGAVGLSDGSSDPLTSITARGRRWLSPDVGLDLSAGAIFRDPARFEQSGRVIGGLAEARLDFNDDVHAGVRLEQMTITPVRMGDATDPGGPQRAVSLVLGVGSEWAVASSAAAGAFVLAQIIGYIREGT